MDAPALRLGCRYPLTTTMVRTNYKDLLYVRSRYTTKDQLRAAIRELVNAIFRERQAHIWGEGTTACASDSKNSAPGTGTC
jgi:TnpA family transposase